MDFLKVIAVSLMMLVASSVSAQDTERTSFVPAMVKQVLLDPTTYAPAAVAWQATRLDWQSSQIFFKNGWSEHNARYTVSGRPDDVAMEYGAGNRQILRDSLTDLQMSLANNFSERVVERLLKERYPNHHKLLATLGWIERGATASFWSYRLSASHFAQWQKNQRLAGQFAQPGNP